MTAEGKGRDSVAGIDEDILLASRLNWLSAAACVGFSSSHRPSSNYRGKPTGSVTVPRQRKEMNDLFIELGPATFRRAYRMEEITFKHLFSVLETQLKKPQRKRGRAPNGHKTLKLLPGLAWLSDGVQGETNMILLLYMVFLRMRC